MPAVEVEELAVSYGEHLAVKAVSFSVKAGEVLALLGPNGAGKTTALETLEGYRSPSSGSLRVLGLDPWRDHERLVGRIGVVLQDGGVYPVMSPLRVLGLFASYYDRPRAPAELIELLGLGDVSKTPFKRLSGGERQRLLIALALVGRPEVCFLDEPTAGVDPAGRVVVRDVVAACREEGAAVVLTSHELDEVERLADRVVIIDRGLVVAEGRPGELGGNQELRFSVEVPFDLTALSAHLGVEVLVESPTSYRLAALPDPELVGRLTSWLANQRLPIGELRMGRERLEDVFLRLLSKEES